MTDYALLKFLEKTLFRVTILQNNNSHSQMSTKKGRKKRSLPLHPTTGSSSLNNQMSANGGTCASTGTEAQSSTQTDNTTTDNTTTDNTTMVSNESDVATTMIGNTDSISTANKQSAIDELTPKKSNVTDVIASSSDNTNTAQNNANYDLPEKLRPSRKKRSKTTKTEQKNNNLKRNNDNLAQIMQYPVLAKDYREKNNFSRRFNRWLKIYASDNHREKEEVLEDLKNGILYYNDNCVGRGIHLSNITLSSNSNDQSVENVTIEDTSKVSEKTSNDDHEEFDQTICETISENRKSNTNSHNKIVVYQEIQNDNVTTDETNSDTIDLENKIVSSFSENGCKYVTVRFSEQELVNLARLKDCIFTQNIKDNASNK